MKRPVLLLLAFFLAAQARADIPAAPVMTLYQFNGDLDIPYYDVDSFLKKGAAAPAGTLAQGTSLTPCLVVRNGQPVTDSKGTPYVGFTVVLDTTKATPSDVAKLESAWERQLTTRVRNHHCDRGVRHVIDIRKLMTRQKAPFFDPPPQEAAEGIGKSTSELDAIVRAFHNSPQCAEANRRLVRRHDALARAWERFTDASRGKWSTEKIARAKHLDYTMRTALYEGHLDRGCSAYGACERNIIALSIRNRARGQCLQWQGCRFPGDFQGVSSSVSQYNIWDEYLTQVSGLTACFLRDDLAQHERYAKLRAMYAQTVGDVERILYGSDAELQEIFPGTAASDLMGLRHYYHPPAMGKCFPDHERVEYISGAVARKGTEFALIANTRIQVDGKANGGYFFRDFVVEYGPERDVVEIVDTYPGWVVDGRKVDLKKSSRCPPYGIPPGCRFDEVGRYRRTPFWLNSGKSLELTCRVEDRGAQCQDGATLRTASVGSTCDTEMRPVAGVK